MVEPSRLSFGPITKENIDELRKINEASFPVQYNERFYNGIIDENDGELNKFAYYNNRIVGALSCRYEDMYNDNDDETTTTSSSSTTTTTTTTTTNTVVVVAPHKRKKVHHQQDDNHHGEWTKVQQHLKKNKQSSNQQCIVGRRLYIMTLAVLAPYRGMGIGTKLLQSTLNYCQSKQLQQQQFHQQQKQESDSSTTCTTITMAMLRQVALHVQVSNHDAIRFYTQRFHFNRGRIIRNYYRRIDPPDCYVLYKDIIYTDENDNDNKENQKEQ